jgi:hypothetical protein
VWLIRATGTVGGRASAALLVGADGRQATATLTNAA